MIRAAAKNYQDVAVITDPSDYPLVSEALSKGGFSREQRFMLAKKAFARTAAYDAAISNYFQSAGGEVAPIITFQLRNGRVLRYGENPHQKGVFYGNLPALLEQLNGKELSYNNLVAIDAAIDLVREFYDEAAFVVINIPMPAVSPRPIP